MKKYLFLLAIMASVGSLSFSAHANVICFSNGICIDINDVGRHP